MYAQPADVVAVLARDTTDTVGTAATLDPSRLTDAISSAQAEIDARLTSRYTVPFPPGQVPAVVQMLAVDIAAYLATLLYRQDADLTAEDPVVLRYTRAVLLLRDLATGVADLPDTGSTVTQPVGAVSVRNPYEGRLFGLDDFGLGATPRRVTRTAGWWGT